MGKKKENGKMGYGSASACNVRVSAVCLGCLAAVFAFMAYETFFGRFAERFSSVPAEVQRFSVQVDERSGAALLSMLQIYAEKNPEASVMTASSDGSVQETDSGKLAGVVTDASGNAVGVLVEGNIVEDEDGMPVGAVDGAGVFVEGASGVTAAGDAYYHVVWGDTLCRVSSAVHYSVQELAEYNHISDVNLIYAESDLRIPPSGQHALTE